jgi:hypothetical protein
MSRLNSLGFIVAGLFIVAAVTREVAAGPIIPPTVTNDNPTLVEGRDSPGFSSGVIKVTILNNDPLRGARVSIPNTQTLETLGPDFADDVEAVISGGGPASLAPAGKAGDSITLTFDFTTGDTGRSTDEDPDKDNHDYGLTRIHYSVEYKNTDGQTITEPGLATVTILDTPEPASLVIFSIGAISLLGRAAWFARWIGGRSRLAI